MNRRWVREIVIRNDDDGYIKVWRGARSRWYKPTTPSCSRLLRVLRGMNVRVLPCDDQLVIWALRRHEGG